MKACDGVCDDAAFTLSIFDDVGVLPPCQSATCCGNLMCYGDFEAYMPLADQNLAGAGISLTYAQQCLLQDNAITGAGLGGPGNIGIEIVASPGNVYCCNTVGNT